MIGHTEEFVCLAPSLIWTAHARSSALNWAINPVNDADFGDTLYCGRLRLFIHNLSDSRQVLYPGFPYIQLEIERCKPPDGSYASNGGWHHHGHDIEQAKQNWKPEILYPKPPRPRDVKFLRKAAASVTES